MAQSEKDKKIELLVGALSVCLFVLIGLGLLIGAYVLHRSKEEFVANALTAEGTVVDFEVFTVGMHQSERREDRVPVIEFETEQGDEIRFTVDSYAAWADYSQGDTVTVLYDRNDPTDADIQAFYELWFFQLLIAVIGIAFIVVPPYTIRKYLKRTL